MASKTPKYLLLDGCPVPYDVAPYVYLVLRRAGQTASSIYRGMDPAAQPLLRRYGKRNQAQIHKAYPAISNPPGHSQHDLHTDDGRPLPAWHVGIDSGGNSTQEKLAIERAARHYGLVAVHPYSRGVEGHHWCFAKRPEADHKHLYTSKVVAIRAMLRAQTAVQMRGHW